MAKSQYIVVVGCGRVGSILASTLSAKGHSVVVIDSEESSFKDLTSEFSGFQIVGDASEMSVLRAAKVEKADCLLAVTNEDNINLMVAQIAKEIFRIPKVLARVFDPATQTIYNDFGIDTICPTKLSTNLFLQAIEPN